MEVGYAGRLSHAQLLQEDVYAPEIYFKDPNGLSLEYCCMVRNLTEDDATMQEQFTIPRGALELDDTLGAKVPAARSAGGTRKT